MPFTFSHTAATLLFKPWLHKQKLSYTALILGCMAPDFEYFLRLKMQGDYGHHFVGIFLIDLPVSIILALLIHLFIRDQFIEYSPKFLKQRLIIFQNINWLAYFRHNFWTVVISIIIGIFTHIVWDAFTHQTGFFVQQISYLQNTIQLGNLQVKVFKLLQHASSVLVLFVVLICIYKLPKYEISTQENSKQKFRLYWLMIIVLIICFFCLRVIFNLDLIHSIVNILVIGIACIFWSVLIVSLAFKQLNFRTKM